MLDNDRTVTLHLALFDSAFHAPGGVHWTWQDPRLSSGLLDQFYCSVVSPIITDAFPAKPSNVLSGGVATVDEEWICWFRILDGGYDLRGRPGRYLIPTAFCRRSEAHSFDASWILSLEPFRVPDVIAPPPLPPPAHTSLRMSVPTIPTDTEFLKKVRNERELRQSGRDHFLEAAAACCCVGAEERLHLIFQGQLDAPSFVLKFSTPPISASRPDSGSTESIDSSPSHSNAESGPNADVQQQPINSLFSGRYLTRYSAVIMCVIILLSARLFRNGDAPSAAPLGVVPSTAISVEPASSLTNKPERRVESPLTSQGQASKTPSSDYSSPIEREQLGNQLIKLFKANDANRAFSELASINDGGLSTLGNRSREAEHAVDSRKSEELVKLWEEAIAIEKNERLKKALSEGKSYWSAKLKKIATGKPKSIESGTDSEK